MARQKPKSRPEFGIFNVLYEDGTQTSNRKIPLDIPIGVKDDEHIQAVIEAQDLEIAKKSGKPRAPIESITKVKLKLK